MWEGWKQTQRARVAVENKKYDPAIFPLYQSYTGGSGKELTVDDRQNVLKNPKLWLMAAGVLVCAAMSIYGLTHFFGRKVAKVNAELPKEDKAVSGLASPSMPQQPALSRPAFSDDWRAVGRIRTRGGEMVVLANASGDLRFEHPSNFKFDGTSIVGDVDGQRVTVFSGQARPAVPSPAAIGVAPLDHKR